jgi:hypothetical protein
MIVPLGGFGKHLDAMYEWHRTRGIDDHHGRGRRDENGSNYIRWCFANAETAAAFSARAIPNPATPPVSFATA